MINILIWLLFVLVIGWVIYTQAKKYLDKANITETKSKVDNIKKEYNEFEDIDPKTIKHHKNK